MLFEYYGDLDKKHLIETYRRQQQNVKKLTSFLYVFFFEEIVLIKYVLI